MQNSAWDASSGGVVTMHTETAVPHRAVAAARCRHLRPAVTDHRAQLVVTWEGFTIGGSGNTSFQAVLHEAVDSGSMSVVDVNYKDTDVALPEAQNGGLSQTALRQGYSAAHSGRVVGHSHRQAR